ncbi:hypothetical protein DL89DRAFT_268055, partial [Linderina pennispora]
MSKLWSLFFKGAVLVAPTATYVIPKATNAMHKTFTQTTESPVVTDISSTGSS